MGQGIPHIQHSMQVQIPFDMFRNDLDCQWRRLAACNRLDQFAWEHSAHRVASHMTIARVHTSDRRCLLSQSHSPLGMYVCQFAYRRSWLSRTGPVAGDFGNPHAAFSPPQGRALLLQPRIVEIRTGSVALEISFEKLHAIDDREEECRRPSNQNDPAGTLDCAENPAARRKHHVAISDRDISRGREIERMFEVREGAEPLVQSGPYPDFQRVRPEEAESGRQNRRCIQEYGDQRAR